MNKVPTGSESTGRGIRDKEEAVGRSGDGRGQSRACQRWRGNNGVIRRVDGNGSSSRDRGKRKRKGQRRLVEGRISCIGVGEEGRVISGESFRKPNVVIHLNVEW